MTLGKETFDLTKTLFSEKIGRIIKNFRANSKLIGEPAEFVLRSCRLFPQWEKLATDPEVVVYLRNVDIAGGRKVKMLSLERGSTRQPIGKTKLVDALYPPKKIATSATTEEKHYNAVKAAMRNGVKDQIKAFRNSLDMPQICYITGSLLRPGTRTDVDHVGVPFSQIADDFIFSRNFTYTDIILVGPPTNKKFQDGGLWVDWIEYHKKIARYSVVSASANRSKGCGEYQTPEELIGSFKSDDPENLSLDF
jgi:hypothetical protein